MKYAMLAVGAILCAFAAPAVAATVNDGDFENPVIPDGARVAFKNGQTIGNWTVVGPAGKSAAYLTSTDFTHNKVRYDSKDGVQFMDLGNSGMGVTQQMNLVNGLFYDAKLWVGTAGKKGATTSLNITSDGNNIGVCNVTSDGGNAVEWHLCAFEFLAEGNLRGKEQVTFQNTGGSSIVCGLDAINFAIHR
jgi:hypothetical protein